MSTAVLIPCYNEEATIGTVISDFKKYLPDADIYVYDNNSTDKTAEIALENNAIVRKSPIQGKGAVVQQMFKEINADQYIMVDGDATYPAEFAVQLLGKLNTYDMVIGDRLSSNYFENNKRLFHGFGNRLVRLLVNLFYDSDIPDIMTGYRAFNKKFVKASDFKSQGFEIETEMTIWALENHYHIGSVSIEYKDRPSGSISKLNTYSDGIKVIKTIIAMKFKRK